MPRQPTGQIREHTDVDGVVTYRVRFRGTGYQVERSRWGAATRGMTRTGAEHEARLIASQILAGTWRPWPTAGRIERRSLALADRVVGAVAAQQRCEALERCQATVLPSSI